MSGTIILDRKELPYSEKNPLPCKDIDSTGRASLNSTFGDKIVASRTPSLAAQFVYPLATDQVQTPVFVGSGSIDYDNKMLNLRTGTTANSSVTLLSTNFLRYIPGYQSYCFFTAVFDDDINKSSEAGITDFIDGFSLRYREKRLYLVRYRAGIEEDSQEIDYSNIVVDDSTLNPELGNVYMITYGFLGFAPISIAVMQSNGEILQIAEFEYPNTSKVPHLAQTLLPLGGKIESLNGSTVDGAMSIGSINAGIVDGTIDIGGPKDITARNFHKVSPIFNGVSGVIIALRNKTTFQATSNRISVLLKRIGFAVDGVKTVTIKLLKNPSFVSATWIDINTSDSVMEFSNNLVLDVDAENGETFISWDFGKEGGGPEDVIQQDIRIRPGDLAVFYVQSAQTTEVRHNSRWAELF